MKDRIQYVLDFIQTYTNTDCRDYLAQTLMLDAFTLNTDRHFNNLGIVVNDETGEYRTAPIFDNGAALLSNFDLFPVDESIETNIANVVGQPFSANLWTQAKIAAELADTPLCIDYCKLQDLLSNEDKTRALEVLQYQLIRFKDSRMVNNDIKTTPTVLDSLIIAAQKGAQPVRSTTDNIDRYDER